MLTRWLFSTNAKDIGTLYLMYGIFTALIGTAFSILIRLELSAPGSQFLAGTFLPASKKLVKLREEHSMLIRNIKNVQRL